MTRSGRPRWPETASTKPSMSPLVGRSRSPSSMTAARCRPSGLLRWTLSFISYLKAFESPDLIEDTFDLPQALRADTLRPHHQILHTSVPHRDQRRQLLVHLTLEVLIEEVGDRNPKQLGNPRQQSGARVATATGSQVREVRSSDPDARFLQRLSGAALAALAGQET